MAGRVELIHGDVFEGPSDLVVLPCSEKPTVAEFVRRRLETFRIPKPSQPMTLGEVRFLDLGPASQVAPTAAYAASVPARTGVATDVAAIRRIAKTVGAYVLSHRRVHLVAAPLLGAGAGGLAPKDSFTAMRDAFLATAPGWGTLRIHVPGGPEFAELKAIEAALPPPAPRVFISYTRTDDDHATWVQKLAEWLLANGVEARLDVWDLSPGADVAQWMSNELDLADRVLLICNEAYASRADRRHGGVGWEIRLVQGELLGSQSDNPDKFIPIVRTREKEDGILGFLRSAYYLHWPPDAEQKEEAAGRDKLLWHLFRLRTKPPLGEPPDFVRASRSVKKALPERAAVAQGTQPCPSQER